MVQRLRRCWHYGRAIIQKLDIPPQNALELLLIAITARLLTCLMQYPVGVCQGGNRGRGDGVGELVVFGVSGGPGEFRKAGEDDALVIGENDVAVVLAGGEDEAVVDGVLGVDEGRANEPIIGFHGLVEVISSGGVVREPIC